MEYHEVIAETGPHTSFKVSHEGFNTFARRTRYKSEIQLVADIGEPNVPLYMKHGRIIRRWFDLDAVTVEIEENGRITRRNAYALLLEHMDKNIGESS